MTNGKGKKGKRNPANKRNGGKKRGKAQKAKVPSAPVSYGMYRGPLQSEFRFVQASGTSVRLRGREFLTYITVPTTASPGDLALLLDLNLAKIRNSRVTSMVLQYARVRPHHLGLHLEPSAATTTSGALLSCVDYDPEEAYLLTKGGNLQLRRINAHEGAKSNRIYERTTVELRKSQRFTDLVVDPHKSDRLTSPGQIIVAVETPPSANVGMKVWFDYDITLSHPAMEAAAANSGFASYEVNGGTAPGKGPFSGPVSVPSSLLNWGLVRLSPSLAEAVQFEEASDGTMSLTCKKEDAIGTWLIDVATKFPSTSTAVYKSIVTTAVGSAIVNTISAILPTFFSNSSPTMENYSWMVEFTKVGDAVGFARSAALSIGALLGHFDINYVGRKIAGTTSALHEFEVGDFDDLGAGHFSLTYQPIDENMAV